MEGPTNNKPETPEGKYEQLSGKEKLEAVLKLFGTDKARAAFIKNCKDYIVARDRANRLSHASEAYLRRQAVISDPGQAAIHNKIMFTITSLSSQSDNKSPLQDAILREMVDRDVTAKIIREYVASIDSAVSEDEEDEMPGRKPGMSDTAYYHFLSKEH